MVSSLVPPKIASKSSINVEKDERRMNRIANFYERLPKGSAPEPPVRGPISWYKKRYFGKNPSPAPLAHIIGVMIIIGYAQNYYFHLRHHKNNAH